MSNSYIFVVKGRSAFGTKKITAREVLKTRFAEQVWPLAGNTRNRARLDEGDRVLFYVAGAGPDAGCVIGEGEVAGPKREWRSSTGQVADLLGVLSPTKHHVPLRRTRLLKAPVPLRPLAEKLAFVKNPKFWGRYLQGGVTRIPDQDFEVILGR